MRLPILAICLALSCTWSCGNSNGGDGQRGQVAEGQQARIDTALKLSKSTAPKALFIGNAAAGELQSLQYYITSITICEDMTLMGSGFSNPQHCLELYRGPSDPVLNNPDQPPVMPPDYAAQADYVRNQPEASAPGYIDLLDPNSREKLTATTPLDASRAGAYRYGLVNWAYPIKVQATISDSNGMAALYTHDGNTTVQNGWPSTLASTPFTQAPAQTAVVTLPNGGSWFRFQNPFVITAEDIAQASQYALDLTFNPEGIVYGYSNQGSNNAIFSDGQVAANPNQQATVNSIFVPFLDLTPVPRKADDVTMKETYLGSVTSGTTDRFDVRIELYYLQSDSSKTILGASTAALVNADTAPKMLALGKVAFLDLAQDGSLVLQDWDHKPFVTDFVRQDSVGASLTVQVACTLSGSNISMYSNCSGTFPVTLKLKELAALP